MSTISTVTIDIGRGNHYQPSETCGSFRPNRYTFTSDILDRPYVQSEDEWQKPRDRDGKFSHHIFSSPPNSQSLGKYEPQQILNNLIRENSNILKDGIERHRIDQGTTQASKARDASMSRHVSGSFQTIFDTVHPQDASVHLELPITDDLDTKLEVFSRLHRLGNFSAAQEYFKDELGLYLSNPYVFVHFAQMLLDKGDYLAFDRLDPQPVFGNIKHVRSSRFEMQTDDSGKLRGPRHVFVIRSEKQVDDRSGPRTREHEQERESRVRTRPQVSGGGPVLRTSASGTFGDGGSMQRARSDTPLEKDNYGLDQEDGGNTSESSDQGPVESYKVPEIDHELEILHQNWRLLETISAIQRTGSCEDAIAEFGYTVATYPRGFARTGGFGSTEASIPAFPHQVPEEDYRFLQGVAAQWTNWPHLFKELIVQGRIWDFKDIYVAAVAAFRDRAITDTLFFETEDSKCSLIDDWVVEKEDESTNVAQLSLLMATGIFLDEAKSRAEAIMIHSPAAMKSRPFNQWIIRNATLAVEAEDDPFLAYTTHLRDFRGMVYHHSTWTSLLPGLYVPQNSENPGWVAPAFHLEVPIEPLQLALNLAKELGDYKGEAVCYRLLIHQAQDPTDLFEELAHMRKSRQGDKAAHLETLLSSYLACKDRPAKQRLVKELQQTDDWGEPSMLYWVRDFVERALKRSLEGPESTVKLRHPTSFYNDKGLTPEAQQFTWENADLGDLPSPPPMQIPSKSGIQPSAVPATRSPSPTSSEGYPPWRHPHSEWEGRQTHEQQEEKIKLGNETATTHTKQGDLEGKRNDILRMIHTQLKKAQEHRVGNAKTGQDQNIKDRQPPQKTRDRTGGEEALLGRFSSHWEQESARPSPLSTSHPVETTAGSEPSLTQKPDGIKHPERRTSWRGKAYRHGASTRPSSINVNADGRPQPVRTTSEPGCNYVGHAASGIHILSKGGDGVQGGPSVSRISPAATGKRPQRPSGSPSYSGKAMGSRLCRPGPDSSAQDDVDKGKLGRESDGSFRGKKAMTTLREDSEKEEESIPSLLDTPSKARKSPKPQAALDPEPGLSRRPTVTDPELGEE